MTFNDEQKQTEFDAFKSFCEVFAKRSFSGVKRSGMSQLNSFVVGQYGGDAQKEIRNIFKGAIPLRPERATVKPSGGGSRRNQSPVTPKAPPKGSPRYLRNQEREAKQGGKSEQVVAAVETIAPALEEIQDEIKNIGGNIVNVTATMRNLLGDAQIISAKDLVERYGRELIFEHLLNAGHDGDELEQKSDRQLANLLKKEAAKQ